MARSLNLLLVFLVGCARHLPMPMTAAELAEEHSGPALVAYLGQRDASPGVCDLNASGPHLSAFDADARDELIDGLRDDRIAPSVWRACVERLIHSTDRESAMSLFDAVAAAYGETLGNGLADSGPVFEHRLSAMHSVLLERQDSLGPHAKIMSQLVADVRTALTSPRLGPIGTRYGTELIADVELARGVRDGQPIDVAVLDGLAQRGDEATLRQYAVRLPHPELRAHARRRVIRLHIQASNDPQVHANAAAIEETLMQVGANPVSTTTHHPRRASVDVNALAARGVRVRQDLPRQTTTLLGDAGDASGVSVLPRASLRGALQIEVEGIERPLTLCAPPEVLDPSPCVPANDVTLDSRFVSLDADGTIRFNERLTARDASTLAESGRRLVIPLVIRGQRLAALEWDLVFETPTDLVLAAKRNGDGADLRVRVERLDSGRLSYTVTHGEEEYRATVERANAGDFHVVSRGDDGLRGSDGSSGHDGAPGSMGNSATCPSSDGGNGGRGEDGGAGQEGALGNPGGRGGNIVVEVASRGEPADGLLALLHSTMLSKGGSGGEGGSGGAGGRGGVGGSGGQGSTCFDSDGKSTTLSGGMPGLSGTDGRSGLSGAPGGNGAAGRITIRVIE